MRRGALLGSVALLAALMPAARAAAPVRQVPTFAHVWTIVLENSGLYTSFGAGKQYAPYMANDLPKMGAFVPNYYGTGHSSLDNYIAMVSGQAPNSNTQDDCHDATVLGAGDPSYHIDGSGQAIGKVGCTYQRNVPDLATQLRQARITWKGYMESIPSPCFTGDAGPYKQKHDPFMYFHNIIDDRDYCQSRVVPLDQLGHDLAHDATTPAYSFITPDQCSDGHDDCTGGTNSVADKLGEMDAFLQTVIPMIMSSPAYGDAAHPKGLIVITFDEGSDSLACCDEQPSPELAYEGGGRMNGYPAGPGGGITGALLLSPAIAGGITSTAFYNHYSYLRSMEDNFLLPLIGYAAPSAYPATASPTDPPGGPPQSFLTDPVLFPKASRP